MKFTSAMLAAFALALSLLVAPGTATAANAAVAVPTAYPGSVSTTCGLSTPAKIRKRHRLKATHRVWAGNAKPRGNVTFRVYKYKKARRAYVLIRKPSAYYAGGYRTYRFAKFEKGRYLVNYRYRPFAGSPFKACASKTRAFRVTR